MPGFLCRLIQQRHPQGDAITGIITTLGTGTITSRTSGVVAAPDGTIYFNEDAGVVHQYNGAAASCCSSVPINGPLYGPFGVAINPKSQAVHVVGVVFGVLVDGGGATSVVLNVNPASGTVQLGVSIKPTIEQPPLLSHGIAFNFTGDAFISSFGQGVLYKWSDSGAVTLWNTRSTPPATGVLATSAAFRVPYGVAIDAAGNMLVSELDVSCQVWLVEAQTGLLRLVAGSGGCGFYVDASDPTKSQLGRPGLVAFGPGDRSVLIPENGNNRILKVMLECVGL